MSYDIYISNLSEDIWDFIQCLSTQQRQQEIEENAILSDRDLLAVNPQNKTIFVVPYPLDETFLRYYQNLFQNFQIEVWVPTKHSGATSMDLLQDPSLWPRLVELGKSNPLNLFSYSTTRQFLEVVFALRAETRSDQIGIPESPDLNNAWTVNFFGSKGGIRQLVQRLRHSGEALTPQMAEGYISHGVENTAALAAHIYLANQGVVLKTNKAHSGAGVVIVRPGTLPRNYQDCYRHFCKLFQSEPYWQALPTVVEHYMPIDTTVGGGNPNAEFCIDADGVAQQLYPCGMRVSEAGVFKGIEIGQNLFAEPILEQLSTYGYQLGKAYAEAGYRGYYEVDCMYTQTGQLMVTESNVRRTGGTHVYHTVRHLVGPEFMTQSHVLSHNLYALPDGAPTTFAKLQARLEPLLFTPEKKHGIVLAAANTLRQNKMAYIIIGRDRAEAVGLETEMERRLGKALS